MENLSIPEKFKIILDFIARLPEFSGEDNNLIEFLERVDAIAPTVLTFNETNRAVLTGYIRDKIVGKARRTLQRQGRLDNWSEIKETLKSNFGERLAKNVLLDKIRTARVTTTIEDFYNNLNNYLSRINNTQLLNNEHDQEIFDSNNRIALECFKDNLPEPTRTIILSRNPTKLNEAFKIILEINHQHYGPNGQPNSRALRKEFYDTSYRSSHKGNFASKDNHRNANYGFRNQPNRQIEGNIKNREANGGGRFNNYNTANGIMQNTFQNRRQNEQSGQSRQTRNYNNFSTQTRRTNQHYFNNNGNRQQSHSEEPMDIPTNEQNFHTTASEICPI